MTAFCKWGEMRDRGTQVQRGVTGLDQGGGGRIALGQGGDVGKGEPPPAGDPAQRQRREQQQSKQESREPAAQI
nr:hypothetical protein [Nitrospirota bacterium]